MTNILTLQRSTVTLLFAFAALLPGCASHNNRAMTDQSTQPLGRFEPLLGNFTGELIPFDDQSNRATPIPIAWRCEPSHWNNLLRIEFRIISAQPGAPLRGWTGLFDVNNHDNTCRTTWVSTSALGADGPTFGTREIFAERGGFDASGRLVLQATQQDENGDPIPYRSTYTFTERGIQVQDEVQRDGQWKPTVLFDLRRTN